MNEKAVMDALHNRSRVRVHAMCAPDHVMAEGRVIAYTDRPTITIEDDDGNRTHWITDLPISVEDVTWRRL